VTDSGAPTTPIELAVPAAEAGERLGGVRVPVDAALLTRLEATGAEVLVAADATAEASRDWWPLAMVWACAGATPARAAAVVRPADAGQVAAVLAVIMVPYRSSGLPVLQTGPEGKTMLDLSSIAREIQTSLRASVDTDITVRVKKGTLKVLTTSDPSRPYDLVDRAGTAVKERLQRLGLESSVPYTVTAGREPERRVQ